MKPKSNDVSKVDLHLPTSAENGQSRTVEVSPSTTLGEVKIDTNQQRPAPVHLGRQESAFHTTGKGE
jgi:hypothetical protein